MEREYSEIRWKHQPLVPGTERERDQVWRLGEKPTIASMRRVDANTVRVEAFHGDEVIVHELPWSDVEWAILSEDKPKRAAKKTGAAA